MLAIEKKGKGVSRMYARVIGTAIKEDLLEFMNGHISADAQARTDCWAGYKGLEEVFPKLKREKSGQRGRISRSSTGQS